MNSLIPEPDDESKSQDIAAEEYKQDYPVVTNHTGYTHKGSENWEHDDTGSNMNYSGCADQVLSPLAEQRDWQEGYDY